MQAEHRLSCVTLSSSGTLGRLIYLLISSRINPTRCSNLST